MFHLACSQRISHILAEITEPVVVVANFGLHFNGVGTFEAATQGMQHILAPLFDLLVDFKRRVPSAVVAFVETNAQHFYSATGQWPPDDGVDAFTCQPLTEAGARLQSYRAEAAWREAARVAAADPQHRVHIVPLYNATVRVVCACMHACRWCLCLFVAKRGLCTRGV